MRSCLVEVHYIAIEHALELLLAEDQQMVQAFLTNTPHEALADGVGSWSVIRCFENLDTTCPRHPSEAGPKFAVVITNEIVWCVPRGGLLLAVVVPPTDWSASVSRRHGSPSLTSVR